MKQIISALLVVILGQNLMAQDTLRVLSWNLYMLPGPVFYKTKKAERARHIVKVLNEKENYDILVFQEAFNKRARRILRKGLKAKYPHQIGPGNYCPWLFKTSSGVWIVSRLPINKIKEHQYTQCEHFTDCFARKGVLAVELNWNGRTMQVFGTHIQASDQKKQPIKESQYAEMGIILNELKQKGVPQMVCGDFNMRRGNEARYANMIQLLGVEDYCLDGVEYTVHGRNKFRNNPGYQHEIDYIFYRQNGQPTTNLTRRTRILQSPWSETNHDLSDHYAVEATIVY